MNHPTSRADAVSCAVLDAGHMAGTCAANLRYSNALRYCRPPLQCTIHPYPKFSGTKKMSNTTKLFEPYKLGPITLPNRLVMAPLTRNRAVEGLVPNPLAVEYYGQRASAGLLITEASQVSQQGQGYQDTPGIYSKEQVAGWR